MINPMRDFLRKDNWKLDGVAALVFSACMGAAFQVISDSGEKHADRIVSAAGFALSAYILTFLIGIFVRKLIRFLPSWIWMAGFGALTFTVMVTINAMPIWLDYYHRFESNSGVSEQAYLLQEVPSLIGIVTIWAVAGATFLIAIRWVVQVTKTLRVR